jgi:hypothetical protein
MINTGEHVQDMFRGVGHGILNSSDLLDAWKELFTQYDHDDVFMADCMID